MSTFAEEPTFSDAPDTASEQAEPELDLAVLGFHIKRAERALEPLLTRYVESLVLSGRSEASRTNGKLAAMLLRAVANNISGVGPARLSLLLLDEVGTHVDRPSQTIKIPNAGCWIRAWSVARNRRRVGSVIRWYGEALHSYAWPDHWIQEIGPKMTVYLHAFANYLTDEGDGRTVRESYDDLRLLQEAERRRYEDLLCSMTGRNTVIVRRNVWR